MNNLTTTTTTITTIFRSSIVKKLVEDCYNELDIDEKIRILFKINSLLPNTYRINIPSLITDDYLDTALFQIEKRYIDCK